jgi:NADH-quinone oxidoreductase subunit J
MTIVSMAGLFVLLHAFFLAAVQVLVYAGAVMVLFLFIIMLLNLRAEEARQINWLTSAAGLAVALILLGQIFSVVRHFPMAHKPFPPLPGSTIDDVRNIGAALFRNYNLPFQIVGVLVLVATIGVVLLSRREPR